MGTQGPGRKRIPNREKLTAEDDALNQIAREAEARLAAKRAARAEAREIRMKELERQQKEMSDDEERMSVGSRGSFRVEERPDRDFLDKGSRTASTLSAATLASLGGASSRRGSCDTSFSVETEASIRDMKESLAEAEEKYRKAMVSNAQLHNEKSTLMFQVETLKEELSDMEELLWESRRHCEDRTKEFERERQAHRVLQFQFKEMKETLRHAEELLTEHGVAVSPELSTNGETGRGEAEDDGSVESSTRLAEEPSHGGRESMLGKVREQEPAPDGKPPQDDVKYSHCQIYKRSQSLNIISTSNQTKPDTLKPVKRFNNPAREGRDRTEGARKLPRNKGSEKDPIKKFQVREAGNSLGIKKQQLNKGRGSAARMCEPKSTIARLTVYDPAFKDRSKPRSEAGVKSASNRDVIVTEMERSFDEHLYKVQTNPGGTQQVVHQSESDTKCFRRASTEKLLKSRLVPPRPVEDLILDNKATVSSIMTAGELNSQERQKQDVSVQVGKETPSSEVVKSSPAVGFSFENHKKDGNTCRGVGTNKICSAPTSVDSLKEDELVDELAEVGGEECGGRSSEDTEVLTDLVENETVAQQTVSENLGTQNEDQVLKNEDDLSCSILSEGRSFVTKLKPSELEAFLPAEEAIIRETSEKINEGTLVREAAQFQEKIQDISSECPGWTNETETPKSSSPFVPKEVLKDWSGLEKTIQSMLRGFAENQGFPSEISRMFPEVPGSLHQWISDFEETLKNITEKVSDQHNPADQESAGPMIGVKLTAEEELPLEDKPGSKTPEDPEGVEQSAAGPSAIRKNCLVSGMLEVLPQTYDVSVDSREVCENVQDPPTSDNPENTSEVRFSLCVTGSSPEEEEQQQSESDPVVTSCSGEFVFVESYFAEPAESGSEQGLVDSSADQVVIETNKQREIVRRSQNCFVVPVEEVVETKLKRYRTFSSNSSKVRTLLEMTAEEIKAMALPELVLMSLQEGRIVEDQLIDESAGWNTEDPEERSVGDMDSCEEVDVEAAQQPATQRQLVTEVVVEVFPVTSGVKHRRERKGFSLDNRKHKTDCKIS